LENRVVSAGISADSTIRRAKSVRDILVTEPPYNGQNWPFAARTAPETGAADKRAGTVPMPHSNCKYKGHGIHGWVRSPISVGPPGRGGFSQLPQGEPKQVPLAERDFRRKANHKSGRPLNGQVLLSNLRGSGRSLQQAAKSFPAERTYFHNDPRLHPLLSEVALNLRE